MTDKKSLIQNLITLAKSSKLITPKHDVGNIEIPQSKFHTVVCMSNDDIAEFLATQEYTIREYIDNVPSHTPPYFEIIPNDPTIVPGSGIQSHSTVPTSACDRFVVVSGIAQGVHLFAEDSAAIQKKVDDGKLTVVGNL